MSRAKENELLADCGFLQGDRDAQGECEACGKTANGRRGWWRRFSYEYDEWDCCCRSCALMRCMMITAIPAPPDKESD